MRKISVLGIKKIVGPRPLGGGGCAPGAPPPGSASVLANGFCIYVY